MKIRTYAQPLRWLGMSFPAGGAKEKLAFFLNSGYNKLIHYKVLQEVLLCT